MCCHVILLLLFYGIATWGLGQRGISWVVFAMCRLGLLYSIVGFDSFSMADLKEVNVLCACIYV